MTHSNFGISDKNHEKDFRIYDKNHEKDFRLGGDENSEYNPFVKKDFIYTLLMKKK